MTALHRKLVRDLRRLRSQVLSIAAVVGCGVMTALSMRSTLGSVTAARDAYYTRYRFADVFASLERAPESLADRIAQIPGVGTVQTRVVLQVRLDVPGLDDAATGQLVSIPPTPRLMPNDLHITAGRYVDPVADDEAMVSVHFARENGLAPGDTVGAVINGRWQRLRVVGVATSPEYVYETGAGGFFVDNRRFGVVWMRRGAVEAAAGMSGAFNDVALRLAPGASEPDVLARLDRLLAPYGGTGAVGRSDQLSNRVVADEMEQFRTVGDVFPLFFLGTAAFLLNVVLSRLISTQRDEIAALKAFGYGDAAVGAHYLGFAAAAVALGSVLGIAGGAWLGSHFTSLYANVFGFPTLTHRTEWTTALVAVAISAGAAMAGALGAVWGAVRIPPAEALRPPSPERYRPLLMERIGLADAVPTSARMVIRTLERRPWRTAASIVGVALAGALLVGGLSPWDGVRRLMELQFDHVQREDLTVGFTGPRSARALHELRAVPGVRLAEPFRSTAVRVRRANHVRTVELLGIDGRGALRQLVDVAGRRYALPPDGAVVSAGLARALGAGPGDTLRVALVERGGTVHRVVAAATINDMVGSTIYMERAAANRLLGEGDVASGAYLVVGDGMESAVGARLKEMPAVAGSSSRAATVAYMHRTMTQNISTQVGITVFAACVIAAGVIYNQARIALAERGRELASLRVLGFTRREVRAMLLGEQGAITVIGIPLGFLFGYGFGALLTKLFEAERHRFPFAVSDTTYLVTAVAITVAAAAAAFAVSRRVDRLDLVAVLKTRE